MSLMVQNLQNQMVTRQQVEATHSFLASSVPAYDGPAKLLEWKHSGKDGMTVDIALSLPGPLGGHPLRGMNQGRENGQRFYLISTLSHQADGGAPVMIHHGEAFLLHWSENGRTGMMARFLLDDGPDGVIGRHPFFGLSLGRVTGEALEVVAWGIGDDEMGLPPSRMRKRTPFHQLTEVQQSNILCRDVRFRTFLKENLPNLIKDEEARKEVLLLQDKPEQFAASVVRIALGVSSRSVMNRDGELAQQAISRWRSIIGNFEDWRWGIRRY